MSVVSTDYYDPIAEPLGDLLYIGSSGQAGLSASAAVGTKDRSWSVPGEFRSSYGNPLGSSERGLALVSSAELGQVDTVRRPAGAVGRTYYLEYNKAIVVRSKLISEYRDPERYLPAMLSIASSKTKPFAILNSIARGIDKFLDYATTINALLATAVSLAAVSAIWFWFDEVRLSIGFGATAVLLTMLASANHISAMTEGNRGVK